MIPFSATEQHSDTKALVRDAVKRRLADQPPHSEPPAILPTARPQIHHVVAWRHDNEVRKTVHQTKEEAFEYAHALHWAIVWKYAVMNGREMIARAFVEEPA